MGIIWALLGIRASLAVFITLPMHVQRGKSISILEILLFSQAYTFFFNLFEESGVKGEDFDASICLGKMAETLNRPQAEIENWDDHMNRYGGLDWFIQQRWDNDRSCWLNCEDTPENVYSWTVFRAVAQTYFPADWAKDMGEKWLSKNNPDGFYSSIPLSSIAMRDWQKVLCPGTMKSFPCGNGYWSEFAVTPDTNYFMHKAMWMHDVTKIAIDVTLGHLKLNNMQEGIPIAPESREADFAQCHLCNLHLCQHPLVLFVKII